MSEQIRLTITVPDGYTTEVDLITLEEAVSERIAELVEDPLNIGGPDMDGYDTSVAEPYPGAWA